MTTSTPISSPTSTCPRCSFQADAPFQECPGCGIIVAKFIRKNQEAEEERANMDALGKSHELAGLNRFRKLFIRQQMEMLEVYTGFETRNRYIINNGLFHAAETGSSISEILSRMFVGNWRPFSMEILTRDGRTALTLERPFRFFYHTLNIYHANGELLGTVERRWGIFRRHYVILDAFEKEVCTLFGPLLHPWTFHIIQHGNACGKITKKWSGFFKELFSKADNFGVEFPDNADAIQKALLLGAVFLIDFVHFEKPKN